MARQASRASRRFQIGEAQQEKALHPQIIVLNLGSINKPVLEERSSL